VGKPAQFDQPLDDLGQVKMLPLTTPKTD